MDLFILELERAIGKINDAVVELRKQGSNSILLSTSADPQDVLDFLTSLLRDADELNAKARKYIAYQVCKRKTVFQIKEGGVKIDKGKPVAYQQ
jgi:hypothetical protein